MRTDCPCPCTFDTALGALFRHLSHFGLSAVGRRSVVALPRGDSSAEESRGDPLRLPSSFPPPSLIRPRSSACRTSPRAVSAGALPPPPPEGAPPPPARRKAPACFRVSFSTTGRHEPPFGRPRLPVIVHSTPQQAERLWQRFTQPRLFVAMRTVYVLEYDFYVPSRVTARRGAP